jgi:hypothetical protein
MKIAGSGSASGSISQRNGSADPDPHQNVMGPQHWFFGIINYSKDASIKLALELLINKVP